MSIQVQDAVADKAESHRPQPLGRLADGSPLARLRVVVIVPCYNEADNIAHVLRNLGRHCPWADVAVIDDGSRDGTSAAARAAARDPAAPDGRRVFVLRHCANLGIGGAVQTGYRFAAERGYDVAVQFDGDGQHRAAAVRPLVEALLARGVDQVSGSRFINPRGYGQYGIRLAGIKLLALLVSLVTRRRVTDPSSGFRAAGRRAIELFARHYPQDWPETEALLLLRRAGGSFAEMPVAMRSRRRGRTSISFRKGLLMMAKVSLAILIAIFQSPPSADAGKE
ncbi:MAG: hypothetical protein BIFFINMI_01980 [Phycisphaerae bacterium]|nr:hypothetical protein [Phycisphaerae bacterium]